MYDVWSLAAGGIISRHRSLAAAHRAQRRIAAAQAERDPDGSSDAVIRFVASRRTYLIVSVDALPDAQGPDAAIR